MTVLEIETRISPKLVKNSTDCWEWQGAKNSVDRPGHNGYGYTWENGKTVRVHRAVYESFNGLIPVGLEIDHLCKNRLCVNIAHLEAVTPEENQRRRASFGSIINYLQIPHAHDTDLLSNGRCRLCRNAYQNAWRKSRGNQ